MGLSACYCIDMYVVHVLEAGGERGKDHIFELQLHCHVDASRCAKSCNLCTPSSKCAILNKKNGLCCYTSRTQITECPIDHSAFGTFFLSLFILVSIN